MDAAGEHRAADAAYAHLRGQILAGVISPGDRIRESVVAEQAQMSRTPVREALRRLDAEGLVDVTANKGARVAGFDEADRREIGALRLLLEPFAAGQAAAAATAAQLEQLQRMCRRMRVTVDERARGWADELTALNREYHSAIVAAAGNRRLSGLANRLMEPGLISLTFARYSEDQLQRSMVHHEELCAAIEARNGSWAAATMTAHLTAAAHVALD